MPGEVSLSYQLNKDMVPVLQSPQLAYVLLDIRPTGAVAAVRMPLNAAFALDRSGSMDGEKLRNVKEAVRLAVGEMQPEDIVSIVAFDSSAETLVSSQSLSKPQSILSRLNGLSADGGTEMAKGMQAALHEALKNHRPDRASRLILLTDGQTAGDERRCEQIAAEAGEKGIPITAFGLGSDWNETLLESIGQKNGGDAHVDYLARPDQVLTEFTRTVQQMQAAVVKNAELILRLVVGVTPQRVWRVIPTISELPSRAISDRDVQVSLGELDKDTGQTLLVKLMTPVRQAGQYRMAQAEVSYDVPTLHLQGEKVKTDILISYTLDPAQAQASNAYVMNLVEKVSVHGLQTRALEEARGGKTQRLRQVATRLFDLGEIELGNAALAEAERVDKGQGLSQEGTKKLTYGTRKLTQRLPDDTNRQP